MPISVSTSIGVALSPTYGSTTDALLQHADVTMYVAKDRRHGVAVYDPTEDRADATMLRLLGELKQALTAGQLVLHCQPIVDIRSRRVANVEALVTARRRCGHPGERPGRGR